MKTTDDVCACGRAADLFYSSDERKECAACYFLRVNGELTFEQIARLLEIVFSGRAIRYRDERRHYGTVHNNNARAFEENDGGDGNGGEA